MKKRNKILTYVGAGLVAGALIFGSYFHTANANKLKLEETAIVERMRKSDTKEHEMTQTEFNIHVSVKSPQLESIVIRNDSDRPIENFWYYQEGNPNLYSTKTIVNSVIKPGMNDEEKVLALYGLFPKFYQNFWPVDSMGMLRDPPTLLGSIGYGQCNYAADALKLLVQTQGFKTRGVGLEVPNSGFAHNIMEVQFSDGSWHFIDPDGKIFFRNEKGDIASVEDLRKNPDIVRRAGKFGYDNELYARSLATAKIFIPHKEFGEMERHFDRQKFPGVFRKLMKYDLLPGQLIVLDKEFDGRHFVRGMGIVDRSQLLQIPPSASGKFEVDLSKESLAEVGESVGQNRIIPITLPYIITSSRVDFDDANMDVSINPFTFGPTYSTEFRSVRTGEDFSGSFSKDIPTFGYALKVPRDCNNLRISGSFQHNPRAMPSLNSGTNRFVMYSQSAMIPRENYVTETESGVRFKSGLDIKFVLDR